MDDKQKLQEQELDRAAGGASPQCRAYYCQNCRCYRNEYIVEEKNCGRVERRCKTCGTTLVCR